VRATRGHQPGRQYYDREASRHVLSPRADFGVSFLKVDSHLFSEPFCVRIRKLWTKLAPEGESCLGLQGPSAPRGESERRH
jgi:hypothetical protein